MAELVKLQTANPFPVNAYRPVRDIITGLAMDLDISHKYGQDRPSIGKGITMTINEMVVTRLQPMETSLE